MRWRVSLICALAWMVVLPLPMARAQESLQQQYLNIYLKINEAEHLEKEGDYRGALDDFRDCYTKLQKIHTSDPNWESALVVQRMRDCQEKIADLQPKADAQQTAPPPAPAPSADMPPPTPMPAPTPESAPAVRPPDIMPEDVTGLKNRLAAVEQELADTKAKLQNSQIEAQTLRQQLDTVNQQLATLKTQQPMDDRIGQLLSQNKALTDKLGDAQKELDALKSPNPKSTLSLVRAQLKNAQDKLAVSEAANNALQLTTTTLKQQLDSAQADLSTANQKLTAGGSSNPEYETLKRENELMRGILTREIQEQSRRDGAKRLAQEEFDNLKIKSKVLQEQLDILGSPMTPPTNDQERELLASLRGPGMEVAQPPTADNVLAASNTPASPTLPETNAAPALPPPPTPDATVAAAPPTNAPPADPGPTASNVTPLIIPAPPPDSSMTPPPAVASNNPAPAPTSPADSTTLPSTPAPPTSDPNAVTTPAAVTPVSPAPAPVTPPAPPATPDITPPAVTTPTPPALSTPADTTPPAAPTTPPAPDTNAPTVTQLPPTTTTYQDTTIKNGANAPAQPDATQYSSKPRLPDDMRDTAQQAADLFKMQRYDEASAKYQTIIDKYPESLYAWSNLGVVRFQQGNLPEALRALQQAVKLSPTDAFSYSNLGIVYYQMNQYENAIDALERALALDPNDAKSHNYLGCACSQKGWQEVAEKEFLKAIAIDDSFGDAHFNLALVYATEKPASLEMARRHYNRALELGIAKDPRLEKLLQP